MQKSDLTIAAPSWKRADSCFTHKYWPDVRYVVSEDQADEYKKQGVNVWTCPNSAQGNLCRVRNWILDNSPTEQVLLVDDDLSGLGRWNGNKMKKMTGTEGVEAVEQGFELARQFETPYWGVNCLPDKGTYREYTPFSFNNYIGGPFQAFQVNKCDGIRDDRDWETLRLVYFCLSYFKLL